MAKTKTYKVKSTYTFEVIWEIKTQDSLLAEEFAKKHCGCISPNYHSSLPDDMVTWDWDVHPSEQTHELI